MEAFLRLHRPSVRWTCMATLRRADKLLWILTLVACLWIVPGTTLAQVETISAEQGKGLLIVDVGPGMFLLKIGGDLWQVMPAPNAKLELVGTASRAMLRPGEFISCFVALDEFGKATESVTRVTFSGSGTAGVTAGGLGLGEQGAKRVSGKRPAGSYMILGTIKAVKDNTVTVQVGKEKFDLTVPAGVELIVNTQNIGFASKGDTIDVEGQYQQPGQLLASSITITLTNPLEPRSKQKPLKKKPVAP